MFKHSTLLAIKDSELLDSEEFAGVIAARAINTVTKVKAKDLTVTGRYSKKLIRKIAEAMSCSKEEAEVYLAMTLGVQEYEDRMSLSGVGGCTPITIGDALSRRIL